MAVPTLTLAGPATATTADTLDYTVSLASLADAAVVEVEFKPEGNLEFVEAASLIPGLNVAYVLKRANGNYRVVLWAQEGAGLSIDGAAPIVRLSFKPTGAGEGKLTLVGSEGAVYVPGGSVEAPFGDAEYVEVTVPTGAAATVTTEIAKYYDPYDLNRDGAVNIADLAYAQIFYMASSAAGGDRWVHVAERGIDVDASGVVDVADFIIIIEHLYQD
jgi:hypothetical protein